MEIYLRTMKKKSTKTYTVSAHFRVSFNEEVATFSIFLLLFIQNVVQTLKQLV